MADKTASLEPKPGFDWGHVAWGRPDSVVSPLCSYCSASFKAADVPLMMWTSEGYCAKFCTRCQRDWWGLTSFDEEPDDD